MHNEDFKVIQSTNIPMFQSILRSHERITAPLFLGGIKKDSILNQEFPELKKGPNFF